MRNPNGYGSVFKLSGKRRKPYAVRLTQSFTAQGKQVYQYLGYYETKKEAMNALAMFNANPYDIDESSITFKELYERWENKHFKNLSSNTLKNYKNMYQHFTPIINMKIRDIRTVHLQNMIDSTKKNNGTLKVLKNVLNQVFRLAMELDVIQKDYSKYIDIGKHKPIKTKSIFTDEEIKILWDNLYNFKYIDTILIMIYTGMRIGELLELKKEDANLIEGIITVKISKTSAGTNRVIPIHPRIIPLIENRFKNSNTEYLVNNITSKNKLHYNYYILNLFNPIMKNLNMNHTPHDCRHTFATRLNDAGGNATAIKKMIGHESFALTEKIYTHKKIDELRKALELVN